MLEAPDRLLEERRRLGHDRWDEVWDGVLHMVPPPTEWHQRLGTRLLVALEPIARKAGIVASYETGLFHPVRGQSDYRVPDLVFARQEHRSKRGVEGRADLVVELLSPNDESRDKLPFYAEVGVTEVWIIDPETRVVELYVLRGDQYLAGLPEADGTVRSTVLPVALRCVDGPLLSLRVGDDDLTI